MTISPDQARHLVDTLAGNIALVMAGQHRAARLLLACFAAGGHVLLEDMPGTGKTTLARSFARSLRLAFRRVQFTPDLLPSDILGVSIFDPGKQAFRYHEGPVFAQVLLADEINRASPRTQSALLEAMGEGQVTVDGETRRLDPLFFVVATQNPIEHHGTYPLPEAQMDRFAMRFSLGYLSHADESAVLAAQRAGHPLEHLQAVAGPEDILSLRAAVQEVAVDVSIRDYIVRLVAATRAAPGVALGAGPRASLTLMKTCQALALFDGLDFVTPELIGEVAVPVIAHRLRLDARARYTGGGGEEIVRKLLTEVPVPV